MSKPNVMAKSAVVILSGVAVIVLSLALYRQQAELARIRQENEALKAENQAAREETRTGRTARAVRPESSRSGAPADAAVTADATAASDASPVARIDDRPRMAPAGSTTAPETPALSLRETSVSPVPGGLRATMQFLPDTDEPPGIVAVVVRLPRGSDSRILDLDLAGDMQFTDVVKRVAEDGKFAVFHATAQQAAALEVALSVSGAAVADVRGTAGIGPFDLDISPLEALAMPKPK